MPDDKSSSASWETCSELESGQLSIDEGHPFSHSSDRDVDRLSFNGSVTVQDDELDSDAWETGSETFSEQDSETSNEQTEDDSFDNVLDLLSSSSDVSISNLCECCQILIDELPRIGQKDRHSGPLINTSIPHLQGPLALEESAETGCALCSMFLYSMLGGYEDCHAQISKYVDSWRARFGEAPLPYGQTSLYYQDWRVDIVPRDIGLSFPPINDPKHRNYEHEELWFKVNLRRSSKPQNPFFQSQDGPPNTCHSLLLVKKWFTACQKLHPACNHQGTKFIPTRLIDIQGSNPRLQLRNEFKEEHVHYATLSHCWGIPEKGSCKLTKSTLSHFISKITIEELPKTFRDAIDICRKLDIGYIWIDSLCIIQGDTEDWTKESATMIDVYSGSMLNIAASGASDGSRGCFFERRDMRKCYISIKLDKVTDVWYDCISSVHPLEYGTRCPLETRGWTLQERLLSPRTVHFTREEVFWECHTKFVSESSPFESDRRVSLRKKPLSIKMWRHIVEAYSCRNLTYQKDKLIALAGIAENIQRQTGDEYCAGMWCEDLIWQLCWKRNGSIPGRRHLPAFAPTWSWASLDQGCDSFWPAFRSEYCRKLMILKVEKPMVFDNPFGDIPKAILWLACSPLLVGKISNAGCITMPNGLRMEKFHFSIDCLEESISIDKGNANWDIYLLKVFDIGGLLLKRTNESQGEYKRIGHWGPRPTSFIWDDIRAIRQICDDRRNHAEKDAYFPKEKHKLHINRHVITIK